MKTNRNERTPKEIDDIQDRMGSMEELDFSDRKDERSGRVGDTRPEDELRDEYPPERVREAGKTGGEVNDHNPTLDDLSPETLYDETGSRSPRERGEGLPNDKDLSVVDEHTIGGGSGLDEAELGRVKPLDGKPWDASQSEADTELSDEELGMDEQTLSRDDPLDSARYKKPDSE
ncbi:hypothetical protein [Pseudomonas indica]|uniref:Phosphotransferase system, HPr-related protein n=1 Tax=Pseudomonas indica TaxID=137658 RepID=A0A1G9DLH9_9PSED|nr:hypothetical protein [Pseudomonas indica]SDK64747.1 hypothetical protein SAMN05216186_10924 [Pseudomonas indica]